MKKKLIALFIAFLLPLSLVNCAKTNETPPSNTSVPETQSPTSDNQEPDDQREKYVIDILVESGESINSADTTVGKVLLDKFNIAFNVIPYVGDYDENVSLMLSAGSYPEIVRLRYSDDIQRYVKAGALIELEELANQCNANNFLDFRKDSIEIWKLSSGDGKLYTWEYESPQIALSSDVYIRSDVLEAAGWPDVLTEDEYIDLLKLGMEKFPTVDGQPTVGMTLPGAESYGVQGIMPIMYEKGGYTPLGGNDAVIYNDKEDKYEDYFLNSYVKSSFRFFNRLYQEGILDPECFSDLSQQTSEKTISGRALSIWYAAWDTSTANAAFREAGTPEMQYVLMPVMSQDQIDNGETRHFREMQSYIWASHGITKNCKYPERIMELLDFVSTEEGQILIGSGVEGIHYEINDKGLRVPTEEFIQKSVEDSQYAYKEGVNTFYFLGTIGMPDANNQYYTMYRNNEYKDATMPERIKEVYSHYGWEAESDIWYKNDRFDTEIVKSGLVNSQLLEPASAEGKLAQALVDYRNKAAVEMIMSDDFESKYEEKVAGYKKLQPEIVIDAFNALYEANKKEAGLN